MKKTIKTFVRYWYGGLLFAEDSVAEVKERNPEEACKNAKPGAWAFQFFDKTLANVDGQELVGKEQNESSRYLIGRKMTLDDVRREMPNEKILIGNMEGNGYKSILKTRGGQAFPIHKGDIVLGLDKLSKAEEK